MSRESKKFKVPDELADLYDFANTLDVRHFTHHGVPHPQGDELRNPRELGAWMAQRGLLWTNAKITRAMFETALGLREILRDYLQCEPRERSTEPGCGSGAEQDAKAVSAGGARHATVMTLRAARDDALSGLSSVVAQLYDGSSDGILIG